MSAFCYGHFISQYIIILSLVGSHTGEQPTNQLAIAYVCLMSMMIVCYSCL